jgi:hypothetical protein
MFKHLIIVSTVAIVMAATAFPQSADAAVCRLGGFWDAFPVYVDVYGNCVSRAGWTGIITPN